MDVNDKSVIPYSKEFAKFQENLNSIEFLESQKQSLETDVRQVELLVSKMIELARFPDFRADQIFEQFNNVTQTFENFDDGNKRLTMYYLLDFLHQTMYDEEGE